MDHANLTALLMDVKKFAVHDGPGVRTTLFLKGCSLQCIWCHNPEGISHRPEMAYYAHKCISCGECASVCPAGAHRLSERGHTYLREMCTACRECVPVCLSEAMKLFGRRITVEEAVSLVMEDEAFYAPSGGGATVSGGEPLLQADFVCALLRELRERGVHTAVDTCGNVPWASFERVLPYADMFLYDIKHIDSGAHLRLTGAGNERILENLARLSDAGAQIEIRMPLVPGANDDQETLSGIGRFLGRLNIRKMKILPYHSMARSKYHALGLPDTMPDVPSPDNEALSAAVALLLSFGVPAVSGRE